MDSSLHTSAYGQLRAALLSRHFALGRYHRANLLTLSSHLADSLNTAK